MILAGYCVAILSANYVAAIRGRNFTDWFTEILIALNFVIFFSAMLLPSLFPVSMEFPCQWWKPWCKRTVSEPNAALYWIAALGVPLLIYTVIRVRDYFRSAERS